MSRKPYQIADAAAERIITKIHQQFRHNRLALFDEISIIKTRKHIKKLYDGIRKTTIKEFTQIANQIGEEVYAEAIDMGFEGDLRYFDENFVEEFFSEYSSVTKYVFSNELERKESRLFESLVASVEDRTHSYSTAEKLLVRQIKQYVIDLEDAVTKVVYEDVGVQVVQWVAEKDERTCGNCHELDGQTFELKDVPDKQHYQCRCYLIPIRVENKAEKP